MTSAILPPGCAFEYGESFEAEVVEEEELPPVAVVSTKLVGFNSCKNMLMDCKLHILLCCGCKVCR